MDAAVWTAIGLVAATSLGALFHLGSRIDALSGGVRALAIDKGARGRSATPRHRPGRCLDPASTLLLIRFPLSDFDAPGGGLREHVRRLG